MGDSVYDEDFYNHESCTAKSSAPEIIGIITKLFKDVPKSVVDIGCGTAEFLSVFSSFGIDDILGVDGHHIDRKKLRIPSNKFFSFDLKRPLYLPKRFDLALCLEVAEHIEEEFSDILVDSLVRASDVLLFSAAIPGQGGTHHVNEQWPEYWVTKFLSRGYLVLDIVRPRIWNIESISWWYRQNILIFLRNDSLEKLNIFPEMTKVCSAIHPRLLESKEYAYQQEIVRLNSEIDALRGTLQELEDKNTSLRDRIELELARWSCSENTLVAIRSELKGVEEVNIKLRCELEEVYNSRSWNLTRPLRVLAQKARVFRDK